MQPRFRELQPGSYNLRCEWSDAERQTGYGPDFSTDKFWTGKLTTPELDFTLVAQDAAAKAGADAGKTAAKPPGANMAKVPDDKYVKSGFLVDIWVGNEINLDELRVPATFVVESAGELERFVERHAAAK